MSKGGDEPEKPKMSAQEKTKIAASKAEWDHYKSQYRPIEGDYLEAAGQDHSARTEAQGNAQVMREGTSNLQLAALGGGTSSAAGGVAGALTESGVRGAAAERQERDARMGGALGIGRDMATDTQRSLSGLARSGAQTAIGEMNNKLKVDSARSAARAQMIGSLAGAGAAVYAKGKKGGGGTGEYWSEKGGAKTRDVAPTSIF